MLEGQGAQPEALTVPFLATVPWKPETQIVHEDTVALLVDKVEMPAGHKVQFDAPACA